jgi:predicted nucleic acid-binding protein
MTRRLYVETSALLRALLDGDGSLRPVLSGAGLFTSALTFVEAARAVSRARRERRLDAGEAREAERQLAAFERSCDVIALGDEVLRRAREDFPEEPVRTLDAIHLASVRVLDAELGGFEVASCDDRVRRNAGALGFGLVPQREGPSS